EARGGGVKHVYGERFHVARTRRRRRRAGRRDTGPRRRAGSSPRSRRAAAPRGNGRRARTSVLVEPAPPLVRRAALEPVEPAHAARAALGRISALRDAERG